MAYNSTHNNVLLKNFMRVTADKARLWICETNYQGGSEKQLKMKFKLSADIHINMWNTLFLISHFKSNQTIIQGAESITWNNLQKYVPLGNVEAATAITWLLTLARTTCCLLGFKYQV